MIYFALVPIGFFFLGAVHGAQKKRKAGSYQIKFIDSNKIENFLENEKIDIGENVYCSICGAKITKDNIGTFSIKNGEKTFSCNKSHCLKFYTK